MEIAVTKSTGKSASQAKGASKACSRMAKSSSSSPSSSASSWGLSGRVGVQVLMHRDLITCRFFQSLPRSWLKKYWGQLGQESNKHRLASASSSPLRWSSSPFSLSSPRFSSRSSSVPSHCLRLPVSRLFSPALKYRDRERELSSPVSSQTLDGHPGFPTPGMTISQWGPSTQPTAAHTTSSTLAPAFSLGHSLRYNNSSGWVSRGLLLSKRLFFLFYLVFL